ncbi:hypothetical protein [Microbacterium sp. 77mftsu3.1]|uniref:hypothetical protein n=1 Tax=Microbacterium sp. 77mftsu3.1 TaxID=1761802 RepID=UPI00036E5C8B|nr:hypothetical protein [Microbacterium sp. 77mftsu3.1]SDG68064.1 hypothetical protein SAMN04488590_1565 [Microbacterium sp. 77mftsu3.1]
MSWHTEHPTWRSGPWTVEVRGDELADISHDGTTVLRSIRAVVRDADWNSADLVVDRMRTTEVSLTLHVHSEGLGCSVAGVLRLEARAAGLRAVLDLETREEFATNRTGLVVLHPPSVAGTPLEVRHSDGRVSQTEFPAAISPHQPVTDVAALRWAVRGALIDAHLDGDVFEMEDQRNWTDASFKTYSRPLDLPFPYRLTAGTRVRQSVTVTVTGQMHAQEGTSDTVIDLRPADAFPAVILGAASAPDPAPPVRRVGQGVLVELDLATPTWPAALARARTAGLPVDVRFTVGEGAGAKKALRDAVAALRGIQLLRVAAFQASGPARHVSDGDAVAALRRALADAGIDAPVVGGSRSHFTELNRQHHRLPEGLDGLTTTVTPLFHATGTEQLVESIAMQRLVARQTVDTAAGLPVHIGPVSLHPRFNDVATGPQPAPTRRDLAEGYGAAVTGRTDPRQDAPELAAWTVASAAALAVPGVASLTWFEEWGPLGIRSSDGVDRPVAAAISDLADLSGSTLLTGESADGLVWAVGGRCPSGTTVLAANLDRRARSITVDVVGQRIGLDLAPGTYRRTVLAPQTP